MRQVHFRHHELSRPPEREPERPPDQADPCQAGHDPNNHLER